MHFCIFTLIIIQGLVMLTKIGVQILDELKSELDTDVEIVRNSSCLWKPVM